MQIKATIESAPTRMAKIKKNDHSKVWLVVYSYPVEGNGKCYKLAVFVSQLDIHLSYVQQCHCVVGLGHLEIRASAPKKTCTRKLKAAVALSVIHCNTSNCSFAIVQPVRALTYKQPKCSPAGHWLRYSTVALWDTVQR